MYLGNVRNIRRKLINRQKKYSTPHAMKKIRQNYQFNRETSFSKLSDLPQRPNLLIIPETSSQGRPPSDRGVPAKCKKFCKHPASWWRHLGTPFSRTMFNRVSSHRFLHSTLHNERASAWAEEQNPEEVALLIKLSPSCTFGFSRFLFPFPSQAVGWRKGVAEGKRGEKGKNNGELIIAAKQWLPGVFCTS